jgi:hypothetical protein
MSDRCSFILMGGSLGFNRRAMASEDKLMLFRARCGMHGLIQGESVDKR